MNVGRVLGRLAARAAVAALVVGYVGLAVAADEPIRVAPAAPVVVEPCPTCTAGPAGAPCDKAGCTTCGRAGHRAGCNPKKPVVGQLRPGACFGYFQTQWHRWEDVCPLPYQGVGLADAPRGIPTTGPSGPAVMPKIDNTIPKSDLPAPKTGNPLPKLNPMPVPPGTSGGVPSIPMPVVPDKFGK
ncbi:MAG TPA: hypothetical protein VH092_09620 [Urbifossiella sp.]|jgi:hypothetical protein|nr:hypothetical protein [Urbifossiella sp.]